MKKTFFGLATFATLLLASCSKEKSIDSTDPTGPGQPDNENKGLLVKGVLTYGADSMTTVYGYDSQKRLISQSVTATDAGFINVDYEIERNSNGQVRQYEFSSAEFINLGIDSVVYKVFYNAGGNQFTHKTMEFEYQGFKIKDSTVYQFDNNNRVIKEERFLKDPFTGVYIKTTVSDFAYNSSGDLEKVLNYYFDEDLNDFVLYYDLTLGYDANVNPLILGNEAILMDLHNLYSSHNVVRQQVVYPDDPAENLNLQVDMTYNADNKPVTSNITDLASGGTSTFRYYYK